MPDHDVSAADVVRGLVVALSLGAAAIHFAIVGEHWHEHIAYGLFFMVLAWFQVAWAFGVALRPSRKLYALGIVVNVFTLATYVVAHTSGLPAGPEAWQREPSGAIDIICGVFEALLVVLSVVLATSSESATPREAARRWTPQARFTAAVGAVLLLFVAAGTSAALASAGGGNNMNMNMSGMHSAAPAASDHTHASASSNGAMNGMDMNGMKGMDMSGSQSHDSSHSASGTSGSDMSGMDMGNPDPSWHYTGPPLPPSEVQLINAVWARTEPGHVMQSPTCTTKPTAAQKAAANNLVKTTDAAVAKYRDINVAKAEGYVPITSPAYVMVHYIKYSNFGADKVLDPDHIQSLVYIRRPNGQMVLVAGMYLMPNLRSGPMPGGCLTQWHAHNNLCMSSKGYIEGFAPCPAGMRLLPTPMMFHVWQVPVPGGSLAVDPTDLQVAQAAEMYATAHGGNGGSTG